MTSPRAVLLLSGGLDSTTLVAVARRDGYAVHALTFRYGQRHAHEVERAAEIARAMGVVEHKIADIDLRVFGASALTSDIAVPKGRAPGRNSTGEIPVTYVPARNTIFLSYALAWAEVLGASDLFIGVNALDYSGYPDCRPAFIAAFEAMANLATRAGVEGTSRFCVHAPLVMLSKADIIRLGVSLGVDYAATTSCYDPDAEGRACGQCDSCQLRYNGFSQAGVPDPTRYAPGGREHPASRVPRPGS